MLRLDHVIYVVRDLDDAAARLLDEHGLASVPGGEHAGVGTANRIVPLGDTYIELMGVVDRSVAANHPLGQLLSALEHDRLFAWCVSTDDISQQAKWIGSEAAPWTRLKPDGTELAWRLAGIDGALADPSLPFFIQWDIPAELHPGRELADHRCEPLAISSLLVAGDRKKVERRLGGADLPVEVIKAEGPPGPHAVTIATASGDIIIS